MNRLDTPTLINRLTQHMERPLSAAEMERAEALHASGKPVVTVARLLRAEAIPALPITTPAHILKVLRQRHELDEADTSRDAELDTLSPMDKLRHMTAWKLGHVEWADEFVTWAKDCGIAITDPR